MSVANGDNGEEELLGGRSQSSRISEWPDGPPQFQAPATGWCAVWLWPSFTAGSPGRGRGGRDDSCVLSACLSAAHSDLSELSRDTLSWTGPVNAHLAGHAGAPATPGSSTQSGSPGTALPQPCGAPPITHCHTLDCLRKKARDLP